MAKARKKQPFDVEVFLNTVDGGRSVSNYRKGQLLTGRPGGCRLLHPGGQGQSLRRLRAGEGGGRRAPRERGLLRRELPERTCSARGDGRDGDGCVLMRIEKAAIVRVLHDEPKFSEMFMAYLLSRNSRVEEDLVDQLFNSSEKRLARVLLLMANFGKESKPETVIAKISQETLAEMVGTTRSRVSMFMNKFRTRIHRVQWNPESKCLLTSCCTTILSQDTAEKE